MNRVVQVSRSTYLPSLLAAALVLGSPSTAHAFWSSTDSSNHAAAAADVLPQASTPAASASTDTVTVDFARSSTTSGREVTSYLIRRYDSSTAETASTSFACNWPSGTTLDCSESSVPDGTWYYTSTAQVANSVWAGPESAKSDGVSVDTTPPAAPSTPDLADASDTGDSNTDNLTSDTAPTFNGTAEAGSTVTIFAETAQVGSGVATDGAYSIQVSTLSEGEHSITAQATDAAGNTSPASGALLVTVDTTAPEVTSTVIAKPNGFLAGSIKQAGSYYVYANITETGAGVSSVTADVTTVTTGGSTVALTAGSYSANGLPYNYRSAALDATSGLTDTEGSRGYSIVSTDVAGNQQTQGAFSVIVDNTAPAASDVQTADGGGTVGLAQAADTITFTFSEQIDPYSILSGWDGSSTSVVVRLIDGGCTLLLLCSNDSFRIFDASNSAALPFGAVNLGRADYHGGLDLAGSQDPITFGASGTPSAMVRSGSTITITMGTASGTANTAGGNGTMVWSPSTSPYDAAGNNLSSTSATESGTADKEF
ncbi:MAG: Ig-like domain-containing protein [Actinomycetota bacterium]